MLTQTELPINISGMPSVQMKMNFSGLIIVWIKFQNYIEAF